MKILVIGDSCKDKYIYGLCERMCPEAPVPVFQPIKEKTNMGMAGNVAANVISLGYECDIITNDNTIEKVRYVDSRTHQMIIRVDNNDFVKDKYKHDETKLIGYDGIIISDYDKGFLSSNDIKQILKTETPTFLQSNKLLGEWCVNADIIKLNEYEYQKTKHLLESLYYSNYPGIDNKLIVTLGDKGCTFRNKEYPVTTKVEVRDVSGAGDTFLAAFTLSYLSNNNPDTSIKFAQECSAEVIQKHGVEVVTTK
jgi:D-glycero-beta-D-manno-heptose-7-phosphate kinase